MVDIREIANPKTTKVFVNGNWVGVHRDPEDLIGKLIYLMRFPLFHFSSTFSPALWTLLWFQSTGFKNCLTPSFLSSTGQPRYNSSTISTQEILHSFELYTVMSSYNYTLSTKPYLLISLCCSFSLPSYSSLSSSYSSPTFLLYLSTLYLLLAPYRSIKGTKKTSWYWTWSIDC